MAVRAFANEVEAVAQQWRDRVFTSDAWTETGTPGSRGGTFGCFPVSGVALGGFAKPRGSKIPPIADHPVAAHEKIAADLAFDLKLPIPPALLWERTGARSHGREVVVSASPFNQPLSWLQVERNPLLAQRLLPHLSGAASAISPFDTWLMNGDRVNPGNLVISEDVSVSPSIVRVAYIDFANSLALVFEKQPDIWKDEAWSAPVYPIGVSVDLVTMSTTISQIEGLSEDGIRNIVHRIPVRFLHTKHRDEILKALLHRQKKLRSIMKKNHPGIP